MKMKSSFYLFISIFCVNFAFSQASIPSGSFSVATDVDVWSLSPSSSSKSWFNSQCQSMFVDNLSSGQPAIITSPVFAVGLSGDYELEIDYALIYATSSAVFQLINSSNTVISASSTSTVAGTCTDYPNNEISNFIFSNLSSDNYQLRITIPAGTQFFLNEANLGPYNPITVSGSINGLGCSNTNSAINLPIKITDLSNNTIGYTSIINGNYSFSLPETSGNFLIEPVLSGNFISTPNNINLAINSSSNSYLNNDFCLTSNISGVEVEAQLMSLGLARPGFNSNYQLTFKNNGNTATGNESIILNFDDSKMTYQAGSASIVPTSVSSNSLTWNYSSLTSLETRNITFSFYILPPPTVASGDILNFSGNITPLADVNPANNLFNLDQTVVNAYDPNDVLCLEGTGILPTQIGEDLTYRIRFQNTGTASAVNITVRTDLDADLDWTTFEPISASHAYTTTVENGNELSFYFKDIFLADSTSNEPASHGWIFYKVKPKNAVVIGNTFDAAASIYFDFNPAVVTNTYTTTVIPPNSTYVPDDNFEQRLIQLGYDSGPLDNYVLTANINALTTLDLGLQGISDLTGIEDFIALETLYCNANQLTELDVSANVNLATLVCNANLLTSLDLSQNINLTLVSCTSNNLSSIVFGNPSILFELYITSNSFTGFDASDLTSLGAFRCQNNQLTSLNLKNGNNTGLVVFKATGNPGLNCIDVDDAAYSAANWTDIDAGTSFSTDCTGIYVDHTATGNNDGSSWQDAFTDLQDALVVGMDATIHIAEGIYYPTSGTARGVAFEIPNGATVLGGYPNGGGTRNPSSNETILSGNIDGVGSFSGNSFHVVSVKNVNDVTLNGLSIRDGNADNLSSFGRSRGGGLFVNNATLTLKDVEVKWNKAIYGAGIFATLSPSVTVEGCTFKKNTADYGSAIYHSNQTHFYMDKTRVLDNNSLVRCAIEVNNSLYTKIENSVIANNASGNANAIAFIATNRDGSCDIYNTTILGETKNKFLITMQVGFGDQLDLSLFNSIVAHQDPAFYKTFKDYNNGVLNLNTASCYIMGSTVLGNATNNLYSATVGDLMLNPDYSLNPCSPGIDNGDNAYAQGIDSDIDGNQRIVNVVDIGAYENASACRVARQEIDVFDNSTIYFYPNPARDIITIQGELKNPRFHLFDLLGKEVLDVKEQQEINLGQLPQGIYILRIMEGDQLLESLKVIKN